jgi:hypothetical protein
MIRLEFPSLNANRKSNKNVEQQGCQIFLVQHTKTEKMYQNGSELDRMAIKFTNIFLCTTVPKCAQSGIFGLKMYHLAILLNNRDKITLIEFDCESIRPKAIVPREPRHCHDCG